MLLTNRTVLSFVSLFTLAFVFSPTFSSILALNITSTYNKMMIYLLETYCMKYFIMIDIYILHKIYT